MLAEWAQPGHLPPDAWIWDGGGTYHPLLRVIDFGAGDCGCEDKEAGERHGVHLLVDDGAGSDDPLTIGVVDFMQAVPHLRPLNMPGGGV